MPEFKHSPVHELKLEPSGLIEAAFAQFDVVDSDGDVTVRGAFPVKDVPMSAYGHSSWDGALPVGKGTISERGDWAVFTGQMFMDTTHGRDAYETIKGLGPLAEFSYGYKPTEFSYGQQDGKNVRFLKALDVFEVSSVLKGAGVGTHLLAIKSGAPGSDAPKAEQILWYAEVVPAILAQYQGHADVRAKDGRKLSRSDYAALEDLLAAYTAGSETISTLLASREPKADAVTLDVLVSTAKRLGVPI